MDKLDKRQNGVLIISLSRAYQHIHKKSDALFYENKLTMSQFMVLEALLHKGDLTIKQIINMVLSSSGNITVVVRNLESRGLVCRMDNPLDKRSFLIKLTKLGKDLIQPIYAQHMEYVQESLANISITEKEMLISTFKKIYKEKK